MEDLIREFFSLGFDYGYGCVTGGGFDRGTGDGSFFHSSDHCEDDGEDIGDGYGDGDGGGWFWNSGVGSEDGSGRGMGESVGSGYEFDWSNGEGYGHSFDINHGAGKAKGIDTIDGRDVYLIDGVTTLLTQVHGNCARGDILDADMTLTPCWIAKEGGLFAHGETLHKAQAALREKLLENMPEEERIEAFVEAHTAGRVYPNADFFDWHHHLTGSCEMGRRQFAKDYGIDVEAGSMTPEEFIRLTENNYGGDVIRKLRPFYGMSSRKGE